MNELLIQENPDFAKGFIDVEFENRDLSGNVFSGIPFRDFRISKSILNDTSFDNTDLRLVEWFQSDAKKASITGGTTANFEISYCKIIRFAMKNCTNSKLTLKNSEAHNSVFENSVFTDSAFVDNEMYKTRFTGCIFINVVFSGNPSNEIYGMQGVRFERCTFIECRFKNVSISQGEMSDSIVVKTEFDGVTSDDIRFNAVSLL